MSVRRFFSKIAHSVRAVLFRRVGPDDLVGRHQHGPAFDSSGPRHRRGLACHNQPVSAKRETFTVQERGQLARWWRAHESNKRDHRHVDRLHDRTQRNQVVTELQPVTLTETCVRIGGVLRMCVDVCCACFLSVACLFSAVPGSTGVLQTVCHDQGRATYDRRDS